MKTENLTVGMTVKNYNELCNLLGVEAKKSTNTRSRKLHHAHFEQYFSYKKQGQKYIITEIHDCVENKIKRGGNNSVFVEDFKKLMIYMLHKNRSECMLMSKGSIFKATNLVNENYILARTNIPKLSELVELPQSAIYEFYDYNASKLRDTVERNLKSCRRESILTYETVIAVAIYEAIVATNELGKHIVDESGELISSVSLVYREATTKERQLILKHEHEVMKELGFKDHKEIFLSGKWKQFKKEVENRLKKGRNNIKFYYEAYRITWNNYRIDEEFNSLCKDIPKKEVSKSINDNIKKSITRSTKLRHTKALKDNSFGTMRSKKVDYQASNEYVQEQEQLTMTLIDMTSRSLKSEFEKKVNYPKLNAINNKNEVEQIELELDWDFDEEVDF